MLFTISKISFRSRDIQDFEICNLTKRWRHKLNQILIKFHEKDISANFYQKTLILCGKILLDVLHTMS